MAYSFQNVQIAEVERLWLNEQYQSQEFDVKKTKVRLYGKIPHDFDVRAIDLRLIRHDHLTLIGIWHVDPKSSVFTNVEQVILHIKNLILKKPGVETISASMVAEEIGVLQESDVATALRLMSDMDNFTSSASYSNDLRGYSSITFGHDDNGYDAYLAFENIFDLMDEFYLRSAPSQNSIQFFNPLLNGREEREPTTEKKVNPNTAFIIMPIDPSKPELDDVRNVIKEVCKKFGIKAVRADDIQHQERITDVVLQQIRESEHLIADLSYERPNVYYEIGYAHAIGKRPILYRKQGMSLHFDLSVHNVPEFKNLSELRLMLEERLEAILGRKAK